MGEQMGPYMLSHDYEPLQLLGSRELWLSNSK